MQYHHRPPFQGWRLSSQRTTNREVVKGSGWVQLVIHLTDPKHDHHPKLLFLCWLQWQLHKQLLSASQYAAQHRVALKGDLPIGTIPSACPEPTKRNVSSCCLADHQVSQQNWHGPVELLTVL